MKYAGIKLKKILKIYDKNIKRPNTLEEFNVFFFFKIIKKSTKKYMSPWLEIDKLLAKNFIKDNFCGEIYFVRGVVLCN